MYAQAGDRLIVGGNPERTALIIGVPHADGTPPYVVKWLATGHIAMVSPGQFARVIRGARQAAGRLQPDEPLAAATTPRSPARPSEPSRGARM